MGEITDPRLLAEFGAGPAPAAPPRFMPTKPADPRRPFEAPLAAADLAIKQGQAAQTPADIAKANADAAKATGEAGKIAREAADKVEKERMSRIKDGLQADNVLDAIERARGQVNGGGATGNVAGSSVYKYIPLLGQGSANLSATLEGIKGSIINDTLKQLKDLSANGSSGYGSFTETEADRLAAAVASVNQAQSADELLNSLAVVERHYRNGLALLNGDDPRNPDIAKRYGVIPKDELPGRKDDGASGDQLTFANGKTRIEPDPALKGVNAHIRSMIGAGAAPGDIVSYMNSVQPGLGDQRAGDVAAATAYRKQNPQTPLSKYTVSVENREVPMSGLRQGLNAAAQTPGGAYGLNALDAISFGTADNFTSNPALTRGAISAISSNNPVSSFAGNLTGGALSIAGLEGGLGALGLARGAGALAPRALGADVLYGAGYGAGSADEGNRFTGALGGGLTSAAGGAVGRKAFQSAGRMFAGVRDPDVNLLRERGVPMTVGQMLGGGAKAREDRLSGFGGIGDRIGRQRRTGVENFNRAAFEEGLKPIDMLPTLTREQGIEAAQKATSDAYGRALDGVIVQADQPFMGALSQAKQRGSQIPGELAGEVGNTLASRVGPFIEPETGVISGRNMQEILRGLREDRAAFAGKPRYDLFSGEIGEIEDATRDLVGRQAPRVLPGLDSANAAYRNTSVLADAVSKGLNTDGLFTPAQLGQSARSNTRMFGGKRAAATTRRPFFDLQRAGQNVLPSQVPDSGTAGRTAADGGLGTILRAAARNVVNAPLYSDLTQPILGRLLIDRAPGAIAFGRGVERLARPAGMFAAPLALQWQGN